MHQPRQPKGQERTGLRTTCNRSQAPGILERLSLNDAAQAELDILNPKHSSKEEIWRTEIFKAKE